MVRWESRMLQIPGGNIMRESILLAAIALTVLISAQTPGQSAQPFQQPQPSIQQTSPPGAPASPAGTLIRDYRYEDLPPAVQKQVQLQSSGRRIADIDRESRAG